jgi:hypothetical protein
LQLSLDLPLRDRCGLRGPYLFKKGRIPASGNSHNDEMANSIQVDALAQLLIEKGIITQDEFLTKLKQVQGAYQEQKTDL